MSRNRASDASAAEIVQQLCGRAGAILEDVASEAVLILPADAGERATVIAELVARAADAALLLQAAAAWKRSRRYE